MDTAVAVILVLTGFCVPAASSLNKFYFVDTAMTWFTAREYCFYEYTEMVPIWSVEDMTKLMNTPVTAGFTGKAWIGLYQSTTFWYWTDGRTAPYYNWGEGMPDNLNSSEHCATIDDQGLWGDADCQIQKPFICLQGETYVLQEGAKTWADARLFCEASGSVLAYIPDSIANADAKALMSQAPTTEAWFDLSRPQYWFWSDGRWAYEYKNWQPGQPDNLHGEENCAVVEMENGAWSDETCSNLYPFFCYGAVKTWKTVVSLKIQSSANMEDPLYIADLQEQLRAKFVNQGFTGIKLTWRKLPVMQTQKSTGDTGAC